MRPHDPLAWHVLQFSDVLDLEFANALAAHEPTTLWQPVWQLVPGIGDAPHAAQTVQTSGLQIRRFPAQRFLAQLPVALLQTTGGSLLRRLLRQTPHPEQTALLCTTPFAAPIALRWPGPVVYWLADFIARYHGQRFEHVRSLDTMLCRAATLVCPNSQRLADYLQARAGCPPSRCVVLPNATSERSLLPAPLQRPEPLPELADLPHPVAGVIGNLAENMDWVFLERLLELTPWLHWLFVGPADQPIADPAQRAARAVLMQHERARFLGARPYTELFRYARAVEVAVLPYRLREPTFSGSSTRFFDHLAACHPILATPCVEDLLHREPLLRLVETPEDAASVLDHLRAQNFDDGQRQHRWEASRQATWQARANTMRLELRQRLAR